MATNFNLNINICSNDFESLKKWVEVIAELQKEHSCNCTLNVGSVHEFQIDAKEFSHRYHQALLDNHFRQDRSKGWIG